MTYQLTILHNNNVEIISNHSTLEEAIERISVDSYVRIQSKFKNEIRRQVEQFNECNWKHRAFFMKLEKF